MSDFEFQGAVETKPKRGQAPQPQAKPAPKAPVEIKQEAAAPEAATDDPKKEEKYDPEELARIFDEIIFNGEYSEEATIRGKLRVRFKTRSAEEIEQISMVIDATTANLVATLAEKRSVLHLQYALVAYQGKALGTMSVEDRAKFVKRLPGPVIGALLEALNKFDEKVFAACRDAEANF